MIRTDYCVLFNSCADFEDAIDSAYELIREHYDIVQDWFAARGRKGRKFARHFDGRTKTRIKCKDSTSRVGFGAKDSTAARGDLGRLLQFGDTLFAVGRFSQAADVLKLVFP